MKEVRESDEEKNVFFQTLICRFQDDDVSALAAQLTYYLILSFFPFLIFVAALLSFTRFSAIDALERLSLFLPEMSNQTISEVFFMKSSRPAAARCFRSD